MLAVEIFDPLPFPPKTFSVGVADDLFLGAGSIDIKPPILLLLELPRASLTLFLGGSFELLFVALISGRSSLEIAGKSSIILTGPFDRLGGGNFIELLEAEADGGGRLIEGLLDIIATDGTDSSSLPLSDPYSTNPIVDSYVELVRVVAPDENQKYLSGEVRRDCVNYKFLPLKTYN